MITYRFDPDEDLTLTQVTQILRELYKLIPSEQINMVAQFAPTLMPYFKENIESEE